MISGMGQRFKHKQLEFWAERGLIHLVDNRVNPPEYKAEAPKEFLTRAQTFVDERNRVSHKISTGGGSSGNRVAAETVHELQRLIEDMIQCVRIARHQGDPNDPRVLEHIRNHGAPGRKLVMPTPGQVVEINKPRPLADLTPRRGRLASPPIAADTLATYRGQK